MSQIDPKWISFDDTKLTIVDNNGTNELSIREDIVLLGVGVEFVNESKIQVRYLSESLPDEELDRDMTRDFWIQVPDPV